MPLVSTKGEPLEVTTISGYPVEVATPAGTPLEVNLTDVATDDEVVTITYEHERLHDGLTYRAGEEVALGNNATRVVLIYAPNTTVRAHLNYNISNTMESEFEWYEGPTVSNVGTPVSTYNRDRNSTNVSTVLFYHTPTTSNNGTLLATRREGVGKTAGGSARSVSEWILKQNTYYMIILTSRGGAGTTNYVNWWCVYYEIL